jgi:hypothetical protein
MNAPITAFYLIDMSTITASNFNLKSQSADGAQKINYSNQLLSQANLTIFLGVIHWTVMVILSRNTLTKIEVH